MASGRPNLLNLATTTTTNLNFQIPTIMIKLDRANYSLSRTTIVLALETFELEDFVLNPQPPPKIITIPTIEAVPDTVASPVVAAVPATTTPNPEYATWKRRDQFVLLWLKSTLSKTTLALVARSTSSFTVWKIIEKTFQAQTRVSRMQLGSQL